MSDVSDRDPLILAAEARFEEDQVWALVYAAALTVRPAPGERKIDDPSQDETERMRADRCAAIADLAVYRYRERLP